VVRYTAMCKSKLL